MKEIKINEEVAKQLGFKSLRGLKQSISRTFGKGCYRDNKVDIKKLIFIVSKKNNIKASRILFKRLESNKNTINTNKIYDKAKGKIKEIEVRQGEFDCDDWVDDVSAILVEMYQNNEITYEELKQTIIDYKLELPITFSNNKEYWEKEIDDIYTNYSNYIGEDLKKEYKTVNPNLDYSQVVECVWAYNQYSDDKKERDRIINDAKENVLKKDNIEITIGYEDCSTYLCIYKDKELIGHYNFKNGNKYLKNDYQDLKQKILRLFKYENIDSSYIELLYQLKNREDKRFKDREKQTFENNKSKADYIYKFDDETFMFIQEYSAQGYTMYCYKGMREINNYTFNEKFGTAGFWLELVKFKDREDLLFNKYGEHAFVAISKMLEETGRVQKENKKAYEQYKKNYKNYDYSKIFNSNSFDLDNKEKAVFQKAYKIAAMKLHPDVCNGNTEDMQILNNIKDKLLA